MSLMEAAPEMAALLLDAMCERRCNHCGRKVDRCVPLEDGSVRSKASHHSPTCDLVRVLTLAGVLT